MDRLGGRDLAIEVTRRKAGIPEDHPVTREVLPREKRLFESVRQTDLARASAPPSPRFRPTPAARAEVEARWEHEPRVRMMPKPSPVPRPASARAIPNLPRPGAGAPEPSGGLTSTAERSRLPASS